MIVEFSGKNLALTTALKTKAEKQIAKLERFTGPIISAHASFEIERHMHRVDLVIRCARERTYKATSRSEDMYAAIGNASDAIQQQAQKQKTKRLAVRSKGKPTAGTSSSDEKGEDDEEHKRRTGSRVKRRSNLFHPKPLKLSDAVLLMQNGDVPVVVYRDQDTERISVLFKDKDESLCLVSPPAKT